MGAAGVLVLPMTLLGALFIAITLFSTVTASPVIVETKAHKADLFETTKGSERSTEVEVAWGPTGHETTAAMAMMLVQPETATWADVCKKTPEYHWSGALHYIGTPAWACHYDHARDCKMDRCVVGAIANYSTRLTNMALPRKQRVEALRFVSHFIGDIHQPLHVGFKSDRGGNMIKGKFMDDDTSLHGVWDFSVIQRRLADFSNSMKAFAQDLAKRVKEMPQHEVEEWKSCPNGGAGCASHWAQESAQLACNVVYTGRDGKKVKSGFQYGDNEYSYVLPLLEKQLMRGGVRLAHLLDSKLAHCKHDDHVKQQEVAELKSHLAETSASAIVPEQ